MKKYKAFTGSPVLIDPRDICNAVVGLKGTRVLHDYFSIFGPARQNLWTMIPETLDHLAKIFGPSGQEDRLGLPGGSSRVEIAHPTPLKAEEAD